jgi:5-methylcytosine-specific restriction protein B
MSTEPPVSLSDLAAQGTVPPDEFTNCPERVAEIADVPLEVPDLQVAVDQIMGQGFYERERVEDAVVSLVIGNVVFAGPPGTGKTKLAGLLAQAFNVELRSETANPEWSVYDVIGSQALNVQGGTHPRHGIVTSSILGCAATTVRHLDKGQGPQGEWLLIDEMNRAEIDRAFGPLFTALSGEDKGTFSLDYVSSSPRVTIPKRFRILCTMNDYDTRFVNSMSGALRRRFARVLVLPPKNENGMVPDAELAIAIGGAAKTIHSRLGKEVAETARVALETQFSQLKKIFGGIRQLNALDGIAIGTSQLIDCCTYAMAYLATAHVPTSDGAWSQLLDRVLETRLISGLETDSTRIHLTDGYVDALAKEFPMLPRTTTRLQKFLHGSF